MKLVHNHFAFDSSLVGLRPRSEISERLCTLCVLPLLLAGLLGAPGKREQFAEYLRKLLLKDNFKENASTKNTPEIINAIRFIWFVYPIGHLYYIYILTLMIEFFPFSYDLSL